MNVWVAIALVVLVVGGGGALYFVKRKPNAVVDGGVLNGSPLDHPIQLRTPADYTAAKNSTAKLAAGPFQKVDQGQALNRDEVNAVYQAARLYDAMANFMPSQPAPDFACGQCLDILGFHKEAIQKYRQFLAYIGPRPDSDAVRVMGADAHGLMSQSYMKLSDYKSAKEEATAALRIFPNTPTYLTDRAQAEIQLGDAASAKSDIDQALASDPKNTLALGLKNLVKPS